MAITEERNGLIFTQVTIDSYKIHDINYGMEVGWLRLVEGPGWILEPTSSFLDISHLRTIASFIKGD